MDLDGTLLGPGGSLFSTPAGSPTVRAAEALVALSGAGVEVVPVSGRTLEQTREVARIVGATSYIAELGALVVRREGGVEVVERLRGAYEGPGTPHRAMIRSGVAGLLLESFPRRLEPHAPWAFAPRESSVLLRGLVDPGEAAALLEAAGAGWLELRDNGVIPSPPGRFPGLDVPSVRAYHLVPRGVGKRAGVAAHRRRHGLPPGACVAVGDSESDLEMAPEVRELFLVANGAAAAERGLPANVHVTAGSHGIGFAEAVRSLLPG